MSLHCYDSRHGTSRPDDSALLDLSPSVTALFPWQQVDEAEDGVHMLDPRIRRSLNLMRGGELSDSDEESSGISLADFNLDDVQAGECRNASSCMYARLRVGVTANIVLS